MTPALLIPLIAVAEAVVYHWRYVAATRGSPERNAVLTFVVAALRVGFVLGGVSAIMANVPAWQVVLAYAVPAGLATYCVAEGGR
jgi:hypothetical protein